MDMKWAGAPTSAVAASSSLGPSSFNSAALEWLEWVYYSEYVNVHILSFSSGSIKDHFLAPELVPKPYSVLEVVRGQDTRMILSVQLTVNEPGRTS